MSDLDLTRAFDPVDYETWRERVGSDRGDDLAAHAAPGGVAVEPLYVEEHLGGLDGGRPGEPPFTRGARTEAGWRIVHQARGDDAEAIVASAARAHGDEADAVYLSPEILERLDESSLRRVAEGGPVIVDTGAEALAWVGAVGRLEDAELRFDPLGCLLRTGRLPYPIDAARRMLAEVASLGGRPIAVDARLAHEAGAGAPLELAVGLAMGLEYLRALSTEGHPLEDAPRRIRFVLATDPEVIEGIAKLRAARLVWSKVLRAMGVDGPEQGMVIHAFSSRRATSLLDPHINVLRGTTSAFAAVAGGADEVTVEEFGGSSGAERLARNTQHILRWESHLDRVRDPAGGSYLVEALTEALARSAWEEFQGIERAGGLVDSLRSGELANRLASEAAARSAVVATRERGIVGASRFATADAPGVAVSATPVAFESAKERPEKALRDLFRGGERGELARALVASEATVSVLRSELRRGGAESFESRLIPTRDAEPVEALRRRAEELSEDARAALVVGVGETRRTKPVVDFARELIEVGGLRARAEDVRPDAETMLSAIDDVAATVVVCASGDEASRLIEAFRGRGARQVVVAGRPPVDGGPSPDEWIHRGVDVIEVLGRMLGRLEGES